jgi:hypothetical protein
MICLANSAGYRVLHHPPKQLEIVELKLEFYREKEEKTKPRHEACMIGLQTSKYMSRLRGQGLLTWKTAPKLTKGSSAKIQARFFNNQGF